VLGPLLGGALVQFTNVAADLPDQCAGGDCRRVDEPRDMPDYRLEQANRFDTLGFLLFAGVSALLLTASELAGAKPVPWEHRAMQRRRRAAGCALCVAQPAHGAPGGDLTLLRVRSVWVSLAGNLFTRLGISGMFLLLVLFLQVGCGWSPLAPA
jgi:hypothetical protein